MASNEDLYPTAAALGRTARFKGPAKPERLDCLLIHFRDGTDFFYEYRFISSVRLTRSECIVIECTCNHVKTITLKGHNLDLIASAIAHFTLAEIQESDSDKYAEPDKVFVTKVVIERPVAGQSPQGK